MYVCFFFAFYSFSIPFIAHNEAYYPRVSIAFFRIENKARCFSPRNVVCLFFFSCVCAFFVLNSRVGRQFRISRVSFLLFGRKVGVRSSHACHGIEIGKVIVFVLCERTNYCNKFTVYL